MFWLICRISPSITGIFTTSSAMLATSVFNWAASVFNPAMFRFMSPSKLASKRS